jgi:hypothetical protein
VVAFSGEMRTGQVSRYHPLTTAPVAAACCQKTAARRKLTVIPVPPLASFLDLVLDGANVAEHAVVKSGSRQCGAEPQRSATADYPQHGRRRNVAGSVPRKWKSL